MANDLTIKNRNEREDGASVFAKAIYKIGFCASRESLCLHKPYSGDVGGCFGADVDALHGRHGRFVSLRHSGFHGAPPVSATLTVAPCGRRSDSTPDATQNCA
jgi:hypothetical protein